jgi:hypothetical protein
MAAFCETAHQLIEPMSAIFIGFLLIRHAGEVDPGKLKSNYKSDRVLHAGLRHRRQKERPQREASGPKACHESNRSSYRSPETVRWQGRAPPSFKVCSQFSCGLSMRGKTRG